MPLQKFIFTPGINREGTNYSNETGWYDCSLIRFRGGLPEKMGGWQRLSAIDMFIGAARSLTAWVALDGTNFSAFGTYIKYYIERGGAYNDITPVRETQALGTDPLDTVISTAVITVNDTAHGAADGAYVTISGATTTNGIPDTEINAEHVITLVDDDSYTITVTTTASSSGSGGGSSISVDYQLNPGLNTTLRGSGWGAGAWSRGTWGSGADVSIEGAKLRLWSQDNFGEDLFFNPRGGDLYYWDKSLGLSSRAVTFASQGSAVDAPTFALQVMLSDEDRHIIAFGTNEVGGSTLDPLLIRWSNTELAFDWEATTENTAGDLRLGSGSTFVQAVKARQEIIIWTDKSLHTMRFTGTPFTFGIQTISRSVTIMSPNAAVAVDDRAYWMGLRGFYRYTGHVEPLPCSVEDYVFSDFNYEQQDKVNAGINSIFSEAIWFYCSSTATEPDRYVILNSKENIWYFGNLSRTCWVDADVRLKPIAAVYDAGTNMGNLINHETGTNDAETGTPVAMDAYIESSIFDMADGQRFMFIWRHIPDVVFDGTDFAQNASPSVNYTFNVRNEPGSSTVVGETANVERDVSGSITNVVNPHTKQSFIRKRGRHMSVRIYSDEKDIQWRVGPLRPDMRPDGRR